MTYLNEQSRKTISEKKKNLIESNLNAIGDFIESIYSLRQEQYQTKEVVWSQKLSQIKATLQDDNYFLFIGRFSSGKSSFINSLLGIDLLPTAPVPCTAVVTEVRFSKNCGRKWGCVVYQNGERDEKDQEELKDIIQGRKHIENGAIHHIELILDVNELGENKDSFNSLIDKVVLVDCPGFDSPYRFSEDILNEYVEKASFTFYLLPSNDFGGFSEVARLTNMRKKTATLIPLISKSDLIEDEEEKERIIEDFAKALSGKFNDLIPIFISTFKYKEWFRKADSCKEQIALGTLSESDLSELNRLRLESGINQVFDEIGSKSKDSELNEKKVESVLYDFNELVDDLHRSAINEEKYWRKELDKIGYDIDGKTYKKLEDNNKAIDCYISEQSKSVSQELKRNIVMGLSSLLSEKGHPAKDDISRIFIEKFDDIINKYSPVWTRRFKEYFDGLTIAHSMDDPKFVIPDFRNLPIPFSHIPAGIIEGISKSGAESIMISLLGGGLIASKAAIATAGLIGGALSVLAGIAGVALLAYVGIKNINPIKDGIAHQKEKNDQKVQNAISSILDNDNRLNFEDAIKSALLKYKETINQAFKNSMDNDKAQKLQNYERSVEIKEELEIIQNNLNQQVGN